MPSFIAYMGMILLLGALALAKRFFLLRFVWGLMGCLNGHGNTLDTLLCYKIMDDQNVDVIVKHPVLQCRLLGV